MKQSKDPFEAAYDEEQEDYDEEEDEGTAPQQPPPPQGPPDSPNLLPDDFDPQITNDLVGVLDPPPLPPASQDYDDVGAGVTSTSGHQLNPSIPGSAKSKGKNKDDDEDEDDDNMEVELSKFPSSADPTKMAKMQAILSQFTEQQMSRYESFRRSALQKANMRRLLVSITGTQKISLPMTIVVCGIAKMFVGELVETARIVMTERKESGPIRPCHIREAYRRLKLEGKVPKKSLPRLFR
ncbi:hypothetical protein K2173_025061 [Erythroxylum novogranatense]|uniref:TAFII28-like protein domain-containing protein n=1 Tax=Erythroxylum novogranatense TaxID=1862640 RepID=A0AAV8SWE2_9ROSI|nr:hypothetical protein K2173_025061 [Erythroxylum novogranatense]